MAKKTPEDNLSPQEREYQMAYGALPNTREELLEVITEKFPYSQKSFERAMDILSGNRWRTTEFVLYLIPKPTPRPRTNGFHFYVKGAAENKKLIQKYIERAIIYTRCEIYATAYIPTPISSMSNAEIYLAEHGDIIPAGGSDVDNILKTYMDMMQGHLLLNDNIVAAAYIEKFYSIKPRLELRIRYQERFDSRYNMRRVTNSRAYKDEFGDKK